VFRARRGRDRVPAGSRIPALEDTALPIGRVDAPPTTDGQRLDTRRMRSARQAAPGTCGVSALEYPAARRACVDGPRPRGIRSEGKHYATPRLFPDGYRRGRLVGRDQAERQSQDAPIQHRVIPTSRGTRGATDAVRTAAPSGASSARLATRLGG